MRELYDRDLRRGWQGVDTGFGVLSQRFWGQNAPVTAITFSDIALEQDQVAEWDADESEGVQLESLGDDTHQA